MHFCHILASFDPGGFELRTVALMNALGSSVRHTVIATNGAYGAANRLSPGLSVEILPPPPGKGQFTYAIPLARLIRRLDPDLILTYNWGAIDGVVAAQMVRTVPVVHAEDGFGPEEAQTLKSRRVLARRWLLRHVHTTVVPSRVLLKIATERFRLPASKVTYIPNGVNVARFIPATSSAWRKMHDIPDAAVLCGTVGRLRPEKNLAFLIRAFAAIASPTVMLAIGGDGPDRQSLESLVHALGLERRVIFAGNLHDPVAFYQSLDVFAMSSVTEQMPVALLEAMSCGLPVVATDVGDTREILGEAALPGVLISLEDMQGYVLGLRELTTDAQRRTALGRQNRETVLAKYTDRQMIDRYRQLYESAVRREII